jgi:hypothetical protein
MERWFSTTSAARAVVMASAGDDGGGVAAGVCAWAGHATSAYQTQASTVAHKRTEVRTGQSFTIARISVSGWTAPEPARGLVTL